MDMVDIKTALHDERVLLVISYGTFMPTKETLHQLADQCEADPAVSAFACEDHGVVLGAIILKHTFNQECEILYIATDPLYRGQGIASGLISYAAATLKCAALIAETDDDAVAFYRKCGFDTRSLGKKYHGIIRYRCMLKLK